MALLGVVNRTGGLTVPDEVRERLGLQAGDVVEFLMEEGRAVMRPAQRAANPFEEYVGALAEAGWVAGGTQPWLRELREEDESA